MSILDDEDVLINNIENDVKFTEYWWLIKLNPIKFLDGIFTYKRMMHYDIYNGCVSHRGIGGSSIFNVEAGWYFRSEFHILPSCVDNKLLDAGIFSYREETKEIAENILQLTDEQYPRALCFIFYEKKYLKKYIHIIEQAFKDYKILKKEFERSFCVFITKK